jgi:hypothetical protein
MTREWIEIPLSAADKLGQWALWGTAKLMVGIPGILLYTWKQVSRLSLHLAERCDAFYNQLIIPLDGIPYGGIAGNKLQKAEIRNADFEICTDILEVLEGKHALLIGGSGDGKTTTAMYIAYSVGGEIKVYDADAAADEWIGLNVIGRCADFQAIERAMQADLNDLQERTILRGEKGSHACDGMDVVTIAEEFPLLVGEVDVAAEWLIKHGKRGRRVKKFILAIAQNDTVANFGIQGDAGVIDSFRMVRLGKKAQAHARKLKSDALVEWLKSDRSRVLVDDIPVQLPPYREIQRVIQQGSRIAGTVVPSYFTDSKGVTSDSLSEFLKTDETTLETTENQGFQPSETSFGETSEGGEIGLLEGILAAFQEGRSDDWIAKNVIMRSQSIGYYKAREKAESLRKLWNHE